MIEVYTSYLKKCLNNAGAKIFYTNLKELETSNKIEFTAIFVANEDLEKSYGKSIVYKNNQKFRRIEKFKRKINFQLLIGDINTLKVERLFTKFMSEIDDKLILENGDISFIEFGKAEYIDKKDTILKSEITLQIDITFTELIYKDYLFKDISWGGDGEYAKESY
ncbi:hypothetical protein [[Clostridium] colinum]|uniref:hypothetical protein n=1 Tax=[Clostridium] colinum TaxID=36835 RepID=UPI002023C2F9|nr:hypothetical protein [[Clostridium] colinum]